MNNNFSIEDEEVTKALKKIKNICETVKNCEPCPFYIMGVGCGFEDSPQRWQFTNSQIYRYFEKGE